MPIDHKRINGPEESVPYELFTRKNAEKATIKGVPLQFESVQGVQRKIYLQSNTITQAKGSCYIEQGQTKLICSVFDPREIPNKVDYLLKGEVACEFKYAPFSCPKRKLHQQNNEEKQFSTIMKKALESCICLHELPNFQVDVFALVLQDDGGALSAAITAAGVALTQAGVPMFDVITSSTIYVMGEEVVEPQGTDRWQELVKKGQYGVMVMSKLSTHQQVCQFYQTGYLGRETVKKGVAVLGRMCDELVPVVKKCLLKEVLQAVMMNN